MVGLIPELNLDDLDQPSKTKISKDPPPDPVDPKDVSFADSFLDFESIEDWFKDIPTPDMAEKVQAKMESLEEECIGAETGGEGQNRAVYDPIDSGFEPIVDGSVPIGCGSGYLAKAECQMTENLKSSIVEELGKVSLLGGGDGSSVVDCGNCMRERQEESTALDGGNGMRERQEESTALDGGNGVETEIVIRNTEAIEPVNNENGNESSMSKIEGEIVTGNGAKSEVGNDESESESSESDSESSESSALSSSSESSSDDESKDGGDDMDEEKKGKGKMQVEVEAGEMEEGEIRDADGGEMEDKTDDIDYESADDNDDEEDAVVGWMDAETFDDVDEEGPVRSKNELEVLPPIPPVTATLRPHHQMLPVGVVLSILGTQVIVEGIEKHNPLDEGSILWITESRSPLGLIDEIFGPVVQPYYLVRFNSESEIPAGIQGGTLVSFVPEFADHVLNNKDVYKKGYDASGANDEEVSDEAEFSDDEKEAEYRRMQKMSKRGMNDQNLANRKNNRRKGKNKPEPWKNGEPSPQQTPMNASQQPSNQHHHQFSPGAPSLVRGCGPSSSAISQSLVSGNGLVPPFPGAAPATGMSTTSNCVWPNGMPFPSQNASFPNGFPNNNLPWPLHNNQQFPYQMPMLDRLPFYQQADTGQRLLSAPVLPGQQFNAFAGPMYPQGLVGQHGFNQTPFGMGLQGQPAPGQQLNAFPGPMYPQGMVAQQGFNQNAFIQNAFGMGLQGQPTHPNINANQGMQPNGLHVEQNCSMPQPVATAGNTDCQQFNQGVSSNRGRGPSHQGGRHFGRGRGRGRGRQQ